MNKLRCHIFIVSCVLCTALCAQKSAPRAVANVHALSLSWSVDGSLYAAGCSEGVAVWDAETDEEAIERVASAGQYVMFNGNNRLMYLTDGGKAAVINIDPNEAESMTLFDRVSRPIKTMAGGQSRFAAMFSYGDGSLVESFQLMLTKEATVKEKLHFDSNIVYVTSNANASRMIVATEDGKAALVDMQNWRTMDTYDWPTASLMPQITTSGLFVLPDAAGGLSLYGESGQLRNIDIGENGIASYALSEAGDLLALSTSNGVISVVDASDGYVVATTTLRGEETSVMAMSPTQKSLLIGTRSGTLYRWDFVSEADGEEADEVVASAGAAGDEPPRKAPKDSINLSIGYCSIQDDYFWGAFTLQSAWRSYRPRLFYYGADLGFGVGLPSNEYPYTYKTTAGKTISEPYEYEIFGGGVAGLLYYKPQYDLSLFSEMMLGLNAHILFNNNFRHAHSSSFDPGFYFGVALGAQWHRVRLSFDAMHDSNFQMRFGCRLGFTIPINVKK